MQITKYLKRNFTKTETSTIRLELIKSRITNAFQPQIVEVENESFKHSVPTGYETHFKVKIVSDSFKGMQKVKRHQEIYKLFNDEWGLKKDNKLHALSITALTREENDHQDSLNKMTREEFDSACKRNTKF